MSRRGPLPRRFERCLPRRYLSRRRQYVGRRLKWATAKTTSSSGSTRYITENLKPLGKTRRVQSFHGEPRCGVSGCKGGRCFYCLPEAFAETLLAFFAVDNLVEKLFLRLFKKPYWFHWVRRLAAAKTSSAGMSFAAPRSYLVIRDAISVSQAA